MDDEVQKQKKSPWIQEKVKRGEEKTQEKGKLLSCRRERTLMKERKVKDKDGQ